MWSACQRARGLPRVAARNVGTAVAWLLGRVVVVAEDEDLAQRRHEAIAPGGAGGVLQGDGRLVQQLGDDALGERLDGVELVGVERLEPAPEAVELGPAGGLGLL